jgi:hypothetical protein
VMRNESENSTNDDDNKKQWQLVLAATTAPTAHTCCCCRSLVSSKASSRRCACFVLFPLFLFVVHINKRTKRELIPRTHRSAIRTDKATPAHRAATHGANKQKRKEVRARRHRGDTHAHATKTDTPALHRCKTRQQRTAECTAQRRAPRKTAVQANEHRKENAARQ